MYYLVGIMLFKERKVLHTFATPMTRLTIAIAKTATLLIFKKQTCLRNYRLQPSIAPCSALPPDTDWSL